MVKWNFQIHTYIPMQMILFLNLSAVLCMYVCIRTGEGRRERMICTKAFINEDVDLQFIDYASFNV